MASDEWQHTKLGEFVTLRRGHDLPEPKRKPGKIPVLGSFGITGYHDTATTKSPGVTVGRSGASFGVVTYSPVDFWALNTALYVIDFHGSDELFAYYFLKSIDFQRYNSGGARPSLNRNFIYPIPVKVPPLSEQKAIAQSLSDVDALIAALDQLITKKRNIKQGTMQQLLTGKKRLPGFSGEWVEKELKSVIKLTNGFAFKSEFFSEDGPIVLTPGNFKLEGGLYFNERNTKRYSGNFPSSTQFNYGDLLVVMTDLTKECNLIGKPAFVNLREKILHNQRIGKVEILNKKALKEFLFYFFLSNQYHLKIKESATGSKVRHTSPKSIYAIPILLPPAIEEQKTIAQILSDMDAEIEALEQKRDKYKALKQGMMQELLTGKTRLQ